MPLARQVGLVVEDAAEVVAVGKHLVLLGQEGAAGVDQVDARQVVLLRDLLRAQVLLHRHRVVGAALHGGVVGDHHAVHALDAADAGDHAGRSVHRRRTCRAPRAGRSRGTACRGRAVARRGRAAAACRARRVCLARSGPPPCSPLRGLRAQVFDQRAHCLGVGPELGRARVDLGLQNLHVSFLGSGVQFRVCRDSR